MKLDSSLLARGGSKLQLPFDMNFISVPSNDSYERIDSISSLLEYSPRGLRGFPILDFRLELS